ncbi:MAG: acyloxyacyl hydrolase [Ignavibacteriales bacterium]|nr:acyloxyacyl hydrolase [Ignavibacteriales bacterium]
MILFSEKLCGLLKYRFVIAIFIFTIINYTNLFSQDLIFNGKDHKIGFQFGYGTQNLLEVDYHYDVYLFQVQYFYSLINEETWSLEINIQPQFNFTSYKHINFATSNESGYEYGLNFGIIARKNILNDHLGVYILVGFGPHYTSGTPERQANGFIFSDNFMFGINLKIINNIYCDLRTGLRHISNADLKEPNCGVNNFVINSGFFFTF